MAKIIAYNSVEEMKSRDSSLKKRISYAQALKNTLDLMSLKSILSVSSRKPKYFDKIKWVELKP